MTNQNACGATITIFFNLKKKGKISILIYRNIGLDNGEYLTAAVILYRCQAVPAHTNLRGSNLDSFGARRVSNMEVANHSSIEHRSRDFERLFF